MLECSIMDPPLLRCRHPPIIFVDIARQVPPQTGEGHEESRTDFSSKNRRKPPTSPRIVEIPPIVEKSTKKPGGLSQHHNETAVHADRRTRPDPDRTPLPGSDRPADPTRPTGSPDRIAGSPPDPIGPTDRTGGPDPTSLPGSEVRKPGKSGFSPSPPILAKKGQKSRKSRKSR